MILNLLACTKTLVDFAKQNKVVMFLIAFLEEE